MPTIKTKDGTSIFYKDWGTGQPIVFSHGWPLSADDWDAQMLFFGQRGYRVIAHDRMATTHAEQINADILAFCQGSDAVAEKRKGTAA